MCKKFKKGFTLVELLVVIAILAILAAVSVVGYLSFTEKAKQSNDVTVTSQLNNVLIANEATNKAKTFEDVLSQFKDAGFDLSKISPTMEGNHYLWDEISNRILYVDEEYSVIYKSNDTDVNHALYWIMATSKESLDKIIVNPICLNGYKVYVSANIIGDYDISKLLGIYIRDGYTLTGNLSYSNNSFANSELVVDGNINGKLTIDDSDAIVYHSGVITDVEIKSVDNDSYYERGTVLNNLSIASGHIVLEETSNVSEINVTSSGVKLTVNSENSNLLVTSNNENVEVEITVGNNVNHVYTNNVIVSNSINSNFIEVTPVMNEEELRTAVTNGGYVLLGNNIELSYDISLINNIVIDGSDNKYSLTTNSSYSNPSNSSMDPRVINISDVQDINVTLKNLIINETYHKGYSRGISIYNANGQLNIINSEIMAGHYAINLANYSSFDIQISSSTITGWAALNIWGYNHNIYAENSVFNGINDKGYNADGWNDFATIVFEADTTGKENVFSSYCSAKFENCIFTATQTTGNGQALIGMWGYEGSEESIKSGSNYAELNNCTFVTYEGCPYKFYDFGQNNKLVIDGNKVEFNDGVAN